MRKFLLTAAFTAQGAPLGRLTTLFIGRFSKCATGQLPADGALVADHRLIRFRHHAISFLRIGRPAKQCLAELDKGRQHGVLVLRPP